MPDSNFAALGERLLRAGIAPAHVRRLVAELETHHAALVEEEIARGQPLGAASSAARTRLGSDDDIVRKTREQSSLRSWGARWPLAIYGLAPVLGLIGSAALVMVGLVAAISLAPPGHDPGPWVRNAATLVGWSIKYGLPLAWAWVLAYYSVTRRLGWRWAVTGLCLASASGALTNFSVTWPGPGVRGALSGGVGWTSDSVAGFGVRALVTAVLGVAVYLAMRERLERRTTA